MNDQTEPADAARALSEIGRRREQAIRRAAAPPRWYWWASAVLATAFAVDIDSQHGALFWAGAALFAVGTLAVNALVLFRRARAPLHPGLAAPGSAARMLPWAAALVAAVAGVTLGTGLSLVAARVPYPATIAVAAGMAVVAAGGQALTRYNTDVLVRRSGDRG
jgi:hypothetical protein